MMCEVGSISLLPHMLLSSRKHFRKAELEGSRRSRAYADFKWSEGGCDAATYVVQIINHPHQTITLKVPYAPLIFFPIKDVAELIVEPR